MSEVYIKQTENDYYAFPVLNTIGSITHTVSFSLVTDLAKSNDKYDPPSVAINEFISNKTVGAIKNKTGGTADRKTATVSQVIDTPNSTFQIRVAGDDPVMFSASKYIEISNFKITNSSGQIVFPKAVVDPLPEYKKDAIVSLEAHKNKNDYTQSLAQYNNIISTGISRINSASNTGAVDYQLNIYKGQLDGLKTDAEINAVNLNNYKNSKKSELNRYINKADYTININQINQAILDGENAINSSRNNYEVDEALASAKLIIDNIRSNTQMQESEISDIRLVDSTGKFVRAVVKKTGENVATFTIPSNFIAPIKLVSTYDVRKLLKLERGDISSDWELAQEDIEGQINDKADSSEVDEIRGDVSSLETTKAEKNEVDKLELSLRNYAEALEKNQKDLNNARTGLLSLLERTVGVENNYNEMTNVMNFIHKQIVFGEEGIFVGEKSNTSGIMISSEGIFFMNGENNEPVASMTGGVLKIDRGFFTETMTVGEHKFEYVSNGNMVIRWDTTTINEVRRR